LKTIGAALGAALALSACATGGVGPGHVDALWRWRDRDVALAPAGGSEVEDGALRGAAAGLARGGLVPAARAAPGALVVEARALEERDGARIGGATRAGGWWMKLDTAVVITGYESRETGRHRTATLPWLGVGLYFP
jgi:hypothetical protein